MDKKLVNYTLVGVRNVRFIVFSVRNLKKANPLIHSSSGPSTDIAMRSDLRCLCPFVWPHLSIRPEIVPELPVPSGDHRRLKTACRR